MALLRNLNIESDTLYSFTSFSFLHFPVKIEVASKPVNQRVHKIQDKFVIS